MKRLFLILSRYWHYLVHFGPRLTYYYLFYPRFGGRKAIVKRHKEIKRYLKKTLGHILDKYKDIKVSSETIPADSPIWVCWLQGETEMPPIVRMCYSSILKHAGIRPVHLVTFENIDQWVKIPKTVMDSLQMGRLSYTHFSDYLRVLLLKEHGGMWIDASVYATSEINADCGTRFYSVKQKGLSSYFVSEGKWTVGVFGCAPKCILFVCLEELLTEYMKQCIPWVDWFLLDYMISLCVETVPDCKKLLQDIPSNCLRFYDLQSKLNCEWDEDYFRVLTEECGLHRITYKQPYFEYCRNESVTFYGKLMKKYRESQVQ